MKWSLKIANVGGIQIYVHVTFFLLLIWAGFGAWSEKQTAAAVADQVLLLIAVFAVVVLHELGHATAARRYGVKTRDITLLPIGGLARMDRIPTIPAQEFVIALAGPAVNLAIAAVVYAVLEAAGQFTAITPATMQYGSFAERFLLVNVSIALFNLVPAFPLDGGRALRALMAVWLPYAEATERAAAAGRAFAVLMGVAGLFGGNPTLVLIAVFVWLGATMEARMVMAQAVFSGIPARRAMHTHLQTLEAGQPLESAVDLLLAGPQREFPVMDEGRLVGVLQQDALLRALERTPDASVRDVMCGDLQPAGPEQAVSSLLPMLEQVDGCRAIPIVDENRLLGLVTPESLAELLLIQEAMRKRHPV